MQIKLIFIRGVVHLASFWKWEFLELGSGLFFLDNYSSHNSYLIPLRYLVGSKKEREYRGFYTGLKFHNPPLTSDLVLVFKSNGRFKWISLQPKIKWDAMFTLRRIPQDPDCGIYTFVSSPSSQTTQHYPSTVKKKEMSWPKGGKHIHKEIALKHKYKRRECCFRFSGRTLGI